MQEGRNRQLFRLGFSTIFLALLLVACGDFNPFASGPRIVEFDASPDTVSAGEPVTLNWRVEGLSGGADLKLHAVEASDGSAVELAEVAGMSRYEVTPLEDTTYRLLASAGGREDSRDASVSVLPPSATEPDPVEGDEPPVIESFAISSGGAAGAAGRPVELSWATREAHQVDLEPPGVTVEPTGSMVVNPFVTTTYRLLASNGSDTVEAEVTVAVEGGERILIVIAGQSNASGSGLEEGGGFPTGETETPAEGVLMLDDSENWVEASEPTHSGYSHSFGVRLGKDIRAATGADVFLVPTAVGGSELRHWRRGEAAYEEAISRARFAAGDLEVPVSAVVWFQGESETKTDSTRRDFISNTDSVLRAFRNDLPGNPDIIFVQLAKRLYTGPDDRNLKGHNLAYQEIREKQRLMEAGARNLNVGASNPGTSGSSRSFYHMVVSHDLPMSDVKHISAAGQRYLGSRIANTFLSSVWSGPVVGEFGQGPRLESLQLSGDRRSVIIDTTREINDSGGYSGYFTVFENGTRRSIESMGRDGGDPTRVILRFGSPLNGDVYVRYMPPDGTPLHHGTNGAVHSVVAGLRLPLPAFGMPVEPYPVDFFPGARMERE